MIRTVLVVDDRPNIVANLLRRPLEGHGYTVLAAPDAAQALAAAREQDPDVILCRFALPPASPTPVAGELVRALREDWQKEGQIGNRRNGPCIIMTHSLSNLVEESRPIKQSVPGVDFWLAEPYSPQEVIRFLERLDVM
jgi:CheY-like chemotaxis protein